MAYEFVETLTLEIPDVETQLTAFSEAESGTHGLIIELAAIHEGTTANFNHYSADELEKSLDSWVSPYPKPLIMNHDPESEPIGRIMQAKLDKEADGTPFVRLQAHITDPEAIKKIADKRYLTGSVGGKAKEANCSICGANWANASMFSLPCKHARGKSYKGKVAHIEMKDIGFKEYSFVNMPADQNSGVRTINTPTAQEETSEENDGWVKARIFDLNMNKQEVVEYTESETLDMLKDLRPKDARPFYYNLKGAFLSALAVSESESKELNGMDEDVLLEEADDDILTVAEELSSELANQPEEEEVEEETVEESTELSEEEEVAEEVEETEEANEDAEEADQSVLGTKKSKAEGQARANAADVDAETGKTATADKTRESEEEEEVVVEEDESVVTELNEKIQTLESLVAELETQKQHFEEVNTRLKQLLKQSLAERVVDTKIALGLSERDERAAQIEEHMSRTARSLKDSLVDLAKMTPKKSVNYDEAPTVNGSLAVDSTEKNVITLDSEVVKESKIDPETFFVDVLMDRKKLF